MTSLVPCPAHAPSTYPAWSTPVISVGSRDDRAARRPPGSSVVPRASTGSTTDGWEALWRLGIRSVVDLREDDERDGDRGRRPDWLTTIPVAVDGNENTEFWTDYIDSGRAGTAMYYLPHLAAMPERTGAALAAIVDAPAGGVLFHCAAGRDRTGLIAMLLLSAVDVEPESIVTDYLETVRLGATRAAALGREDNEPRIDAHLQTLGTTTEQAFTDALAGLDLDAFLDHSGLDDAQRRALSTWRGNLPA